MAPFDSQVNAFAREKPITMQEYENPPAKQFYQAKRNGIIKHEGRPLTKLGEITVRNQYVIGGELNASDVYARCFNWLGSNPQHAQRLYDYAIKQWFSPATPLLSNTGTERGFGISCFLNSVEDSLEGIFGTWQESGWLAARGGGIGTYWGNVRSIGESIGRVGGTSGVVPFIKVQESITLAINQGALRRGNAAMYLPINHPEIEEFIEMRLILNKGDPKRKMPDLHHGIIIDNKFMHAVKSGEHYELISPKTGKPIITEDGKTRTINARKIWQRILEIRVEVGEPYIMYGDTVNDNKPEIQKILNLEIKQSNLCSEITLPTGLDHLKKERTAVCCLSSLNLEYHDEWKDNPHFIADIAEFLDNALQDFIDHAPNEFSKAKYSAMRERSIGLGVMGWHSLLQKLNIPFESLSAKSLNKKIFRNIRTQMNNASIKLADKRGANPDASDANIHERFTNKIAIAPTATISIICGGTSPGIEPFVANCFVHKVMNGNMFTKNKYLEKLLESKGKNTQETWTQITNSQGSVADLDCLTEEEKAIFKTAIEIDQLALIDQAADRAKYIDQSQSLNIFVAPTINKKDLHKIHYSAWEKGIKTLYYCRSLSLRRAENSTMVVQANIRKILSDEAIDVITGEKQPEECSFCQ